ncbi:polysaccharide biosynthesis protein [Calothrix sp. PCC 7716]|nr:polysaccharide biosynthesis protein [Calothrix sp. PCC 7716]
MKNKLLKNGLYNTIAGVIRLGLSLLTVPVLINLMGVEEYGLWALASAVVAVVLLAEAGLSIATTVYVAQVDKKDANSLSQILTVSFGGMLILATTFMLLLFLSSEPISAFFPRLEAQQRQTLVSTLQIASLAVWIRLMQQVFVGVEQAYERYGLMNLLNTIQWVLLNCGLCIIAWLGGRTFELMEWLVACNFAILICHASVIKSLLKGIKIRFLWDNTTGLNIIKHSLNSWIATLGVVLFLKCDRLIVASILGSKVLGVYAAITDAVGAIHLFSALPVQPLLPYISQHQEKKVHNLDLRKYVQQSLALNALLAIILGTSLYIFSPIIMNIMLKESATENIIMSFKLAIIIYTLYSLNAVGYFILLNIAVKKMMIIILFSSVLTLLLIAFGAKYFGLIGAILGNGVYIITIWMNAIALSLLGLSKKIWFNSMKLPFYLMSVFLIIISINNIYLNICFVILQLIAAFVWFYQRIIYT